MVRLQHNLELAVLLAAGLCFAAGEAPAQMATPASATPATGAHQNRGHTKKATPEAETPQPPPPPLMPEQMAPTPPQVTYQNGLLTIDATNSTLSQVLRSVQAQTGASIEMPSSASNDRVAMRLGPGRPRDVLNTLLNGSKFNYIILGMTDNPGGVQKLILTTRQNAATTVNTAQNNGPGQGQPQYQPQPEEPMDEDIAPADPEADNPPEPPQVPAIPGRFRPGQVPMRSPDMNGPPPDNGTPPNARTPEQLLQEMQMMQRQQQIYQQQLNPANRGEPPEQ